MIHQVFFWLKRPHSQADRDALVAGLRALEAIPQIRALHIGIPAATERRDVVDATFNVSELMFFESVEDQKIYQDHALHKLFVERHNHLWERAIVYDSLLL